MTATAFLVGPRAVTADGVQIATYDLGGSGPPLLFAHATGFHGRVWLPVAARLRDHFHCVAFDLRGHGDSDPAPGGDYDWDGFGRDVLAVAATAGLRREGPLRGVGHSCGGAALLLAEESSPGAFEAMYLYEPVVPAVEFEAQSPWGDPLAEGARRRRPVFPSRAAARETFAAKPIFARWDPAALDAYVEWGFRDRGDGTVELACRPEDEARVYEAARLNHSFRDLARVTCDLTLAAGGWDLRFGWDVISAMAARCAGPVRLESFPGLGHFGPLEGPGEVAAAIVAALERPGS